MKKLLGVCLLLSMAGCGPTVSVIDPPPRDPPAEKEPAPPPPPKPAKPPVRTTFAEKLLGLKAVESLGALKPADPKTVAVLISLMEDEDPMMRLTAIGALSRIGQPAKEAAARLRAILNNRQQSDTLRTAAKAALLEVDPRSQFTD